MPAFVERYPEVEVDLSVSNRLIDAIGEGFDAGIRYGGTVPEDMIAQRLSPDIRVGRGRRTRLSRTVRNACHTAGSAGASLYPDPARQRSALSMGI